MSRLEFMSAEHVAEMNRLLERDEATRRACRELDRPYLMLYELRHRPETVYWAISFDPTKGVRFALERPQQPPDLVIRGDYAESIRATAAAKSGSDVQMPWQHDGDVSAIELLAPILEKARLAATVETHMPDIG